jgi:hypothetical protein
MNAQQAGSPSRWKLTLNLAARAPLHIGDGERVVFSPKRREVPDLMRKDLEANKPEFFSVATNHKRAHTAGHFRARGFASVGTGARNTEESSGGGIRIERCGGANLLL